jgi:hypothetical protein
VTYKFPGVSESWLLPSSPWARWAALFRSQGAAEAVRSDDYLSLAIGRIEEGSGVLQSREDRVEIVGDLRRVRLVIAATIELLLDRVACQFKAIVTAACGEREQFHSIASSLRTPTKLLARLIRDREILERKLHVTFTRLGKKLLH